MVVALGSIAWSVRADPASATTTQRKTFDWAIEQARGFLAKEPLIAHPRPSEIQCRAEPDIVTPADTVVHLTDRASGQDLGLLILKAPDPTPIACAWHASEYVDLRKTSLLSVEQAQSIAADVLLRHWPDAPVSGLTRETDTGPITSEGCYRFRCRRFVHGVQALSVRVDIRAWDGKLGAFYTYRHPDPGSIPPPSFSEAEVRRRLLDAACRELKCSQDALRAVTVKRKCFPQDKGE